MKGGGYYSLATTGAKDVINSATPLALQAVGRMDLADAGHFTMTDMGCADGGTSVDLVDGVAEAVRQRAPSCDFSMVYTDQPGNDFNALFQIIHGLTELPTYLPGAKRVFVSASATSFYDQVLPDSTLNLGFSATAMHWLSRKPCNISDHVQAVGASGTELAAFAEQGRKDWETILSHRASELVPGGRLVLANFCRDQEGRYLGNSGGVSMFDTFNSIWLALLDDGTIAADEYVAMTLPQYYKDVEEFSAPLTERQSPVHQAGLRLEGIETRVTRCPYAAAFEGHGDSARFARSYIPTLRSWTESTFHAALSGDRPSQQRQEIIDHYYDTYETMVRDAPDGHGMDYVHAFMTIAKE